ncbi:tetratricopeptide repeat protein [Dactylosporangium sp. CA-092794]|uniref:tetratricopeptide repeat protein n=1 Tax=Dactylosporangium sp. CA-092794 TaxID=3239929 RepID=UPI003D93C6AF
MKLVPPRRSVVAGISVLFGAAAGVVTNIVVPDGFWPGWVFLAALILAWMAFEAWRAGGTARHVATAPLPHGIDIRSAAPPLDLLPAQLRGRDDLVDELAALVLAPDGRPHIVSGIGGCGKTAVALAVVERSVQAGRQVWWIDARDSASLRFSLAGLATDLGIAADAQGTAAMLDLIWKGLADAPTGWLLIVDAADRPELLSPSGDDLRAGLGVVRRSARGLVLVTSRVRASDAWSAYAVIHPIAELSPTAAAEVLVDAVGPGIDDWDEAAALGAQLGGLPLALVAAGRYLRSSLAQLEETTTFAAYRGILTTKFAEFMDAHGDAVRSSGAVTATWEVSLDLLADKGMVHARDLMRILGGLAPAPLPLDLLDPATLRRTALLRRTAGHRLRRSVRRYDAAVHSRTLNELIELGLLSLQCATDATGRTLRCVAAHPVVVQSNRAIAGREPAVQSGVAAAVAMLMCATAVRHDPEQPDTGPWWSTVSGHLLDVLPRTRTALRRPLRRALIELTHNAARALYVAGNFVESRRVARCGLRAAQVLGRRDEAVRFRLRTDLANALFRLGEVENGVRIHQRVAAARARLLGERDPETLRSRGNHAAALFGLGRYQETEQICRSTLTAVGKRLPADRPELLRIRHHLAAALVALGDYEAGEREVRDALRLSERTGNSDPDALRARNTLANALTGLTNLGEAEQEYRRVLAAQTRRFAAKHPDTITTRSNLALTLLRQRRLGEAEQEFRTVLQLRSEVLGHDHADTRTAGEHLRLVLDEIEREDAAVDGAE